MKWLIPITALSILACNGPSGNNQSRIDSADTTLKKDTVSNGDTSTTAVRDTTRLSGMWFLQPVLTSDTATGKIPRLDLNGVTKYYSGNTGCNNMKGTFAYSDTSIAFNKPVMTKMACVGYNEKAFLESLLRANRYKLENGTLILLFDQTELSRWTRKVVPKPVSNKA